MNQPFKDDKIFQNGLRVLLKDSALRRIRSMHLRPVRTNAVFHYLPEPFAERISKSTSDECLFVTGQGDLKGDVNYVFADVIAAEILVGFGEENQQFEETLGKAMEETRDLAGKFVISAESLIGYHLKQWGFTKKLSKPTAS